MIPRWRPWSGLPIPTVPFVGDCRSFDIPNTIVAMIKNAAPNCIAITLRPYGGVNMIVAAECAARRRGMRILWVKARRALKGYDQ